MVCVYVTNGVILACTVFEAVASSNGVKWRYCVPCARGTYSPSGSALARPPTGVPPSGSACTLARAPEGQAFRAQEVRGDPVVERVDDVPVHAMCA